MKELINKEPKTPTELAEAYLKGELSLPISSRLVEPFLYKKKGGLTPLSLSNFKKDFKKVWDKIERENISEDALKELEKDYDKKTVNRVLDALTDFEFFIRTDKLVNVVDYESKKREKKECEGIIKAMEYLLKSPLVLDSGKKVLQKFQLEARYYLELLQGFKKVTVTPVKEFLLMLEATPTYLTTPDPEKYIEEAFERLNKDIIYVRPNGRPKHIFKKALIVVIYELLSRDDKQVKEVYCLTAKVVKQLIPEVNEKQVDNALHS